MDAESRDGTGRPTYPRRVFAILAVLVAAGIAVRWVLVPGDFGRDGNFRASAPEDEAAREPVHQGVEVCGRCHPDERARHDKDVHVRVPCEDCHGPGAEHVKAREAGEPSEKGSVFRELAPANCLACHRRLMARPVLFPTITVTEHYAVVGVRDMGTRCQACHDPHQPLFLDHPAQQARIHPLIHPCTDCHRSAPTAGPADSGVAGRPRPEGHVVTFECRDCHADVVADAAGKAHGPLDCRTCHQFHRDSDFSGRIYKNGSPRFCLMCHQDHPFKTRDRMPLLASFEAHLDDVALSEEDRGKRCADCHLEEAIHSVAGRTRGVVVPGGAR